MNNAKIENEEEDIGTNLGGDLQAIEFAGKNYLPTFYDDFTGTNLDAARWARCPEWQRQDLGGYWKDKCTSVKDSCLVIEARKDGDTLISGGIRTKEKFEQKCGLYKIRFKVEKASGLWYAFWLMTDKVHNLGNGAVNGGEIDIFEVLPNDTNMPEGKKTYLNSALHWDGYGKDHKSSASQFFIDDSFYNEWHEITFEWTPEYYKAYLDDSTTPYWDSTIDGADAWGGIVQTRNYMKITAEFGKWGGEVDENALPAKMYVDWVKVYKAE
jgi:beta-glucanase (GH16 family)